MIKGDLRKQEIMNTAEALFCRKGYEQTSIQDILDEMNSSKGSFYHHFISKEALLESICRRRAAQIYAAAEESVSDENTAARNMDILLSGMIPFRSEKLSFLMMLLPVFRIPEGRMVRLGYCDALADLFRPAVIRQIGRGHQAGELFCTDAENAADILLTLVNRLWVLICDRMIEHETNGSEPDTAEFLRITERYRMTAEQSVSLPHGSLELISIPTLRSLNGQIHNHWKG